MKKYKVFRDGGYLAEVRHDSVVGPQKVVCINFVWGVPWSRVSTKSASMQHSVAYQTLPRGLPCSAKDERVDNGLDRKLGPKAADCIVKCFVIGIDSANRVGSLSAQQQPQSFLAGTRVSA